jgi:hypothetical protein
MAMRCSAAASFALAAALAACAVEASAQDRLAAIVRVVDREVLPSQCGEDYACKDREAAWRMKVAVVEPLRGGPLPAELVVRARHPDAFEDETALLVWAPGASGEPLAIDVIRADPRIGGGWGVCGHWPLREHRLVAPPLEDVALAPAFGNASRLSPLGIARTYPAEYFRIEDDGTVRCVRGWSTDTLIGHGEWKPRR